MDAVENVAPVKIHKFHTKQILIKCLPHECSEEEVTSLVSKYGGVEKVDLVTSEKECTASVLYESADHATLAHNGLNGESFQGVKLQVDYVLQNGNHGDGKPRSVKSRLGKALGTNDRSFNSNDNPLRILVPSQYIGAIIGRKGESIKSITTKCKAKYVLTLYGRLGRKPTNTFDEVDVHGKDSNGFIEKMISIYGKPENCSEALKEILQVMQNELQKESKKELLLKMLARDVYCGRLIGKEGRVIKKIREETETKIVVNSPSDGMRMYPDRVISIRGNIENMVKAELAISVKVSQCIEQDRKSLGYSGISSSYVTGYPYGMQSLTAVNQKYYPMNGGVTAHPTRSLTSSVGGGAYSQPQPCMEICHIQVPNAAVGAIIGRAGANIKQMMRTSGAFIIVESKKDMELTPSSERIVTIRGSTDCTFRGSWHIFEKMKQEGFSGNDDVRLMTMIRIPRAAIGRVIGKSGRNVREIQRLTGALIKLPLENKDKSTEDASAIQADTNLQVDPNAEAIVEICGTFYATQYAQRHIRALVELAINGTPGIYSPFLCPRYTRSSTKLSVSSPPSA